MKNCEVFKKYLEHFYNSFSSFNVILCDLNVENMLCRLKSEWLVNGVKSVWTYNTIIIL